jgi:hypothetical protein
VITEVERDPHGGDRAEEELALAAAARPVKMIGVANVRVEVRAPSATNAESKRRRYVEPGLWPVAARITAISANANPTEQSGTTTFSQRGCDKRRSIFTRGLRP